MKRNVPVAILLLIFFGIAFSSNAQAPNNVTVDHLEPWLPELIIWEPRPASTPEPQKSLPRNPFADRSVNQTLHALSPPPLSYGNASSATVDVGTVPIPPNIQVSYSGLVSGASLTVTDYSEVMVALDPTDPNHLLGTSKFFYDAPNYGFYTGVFESYDSGLTWTQLQPAGVKTYALTSDPVTTFDDQGNGYFTLLTRGPTGLDMLKKPAGGDWGLPVVVNRTTETDKQWIIGDQDPQGVSPYAGHLYVSWIDLNSPKRVLFSRSTDGNQTWSSPIELVSSADLRGPIPGVGPDGTVYVIFAQGTFDGNRGGVRYVKSENGGAVGSFTAPQTITDVWGIPFRLDPAPSFRTPNSLPAFAVSPTNGNLYVAWSDYRDGDADIYFVRSVDGGATWEDLQRLNDDPVGNGVDQFQPQIAVAPDGRVAVMWFDRRLSCPDLDWIPTDHVGQENFCIDTFMTRSYDDGQSWLPNLRVSAQTWDWTLNLPMVDANTGFIGDYQGIASNNSYDLPFWNATANLGDNPDNHQQVFVARVPVPFINLTATKTVDPGEATSSNILTYTVGLRNAGPDIASAVRLTDTMPENTAYVPGSLTYPPGNGTGAYDPMTQAITWTGALSVNMPVSLTFQVTVGVFVGEDTDLTNRALIRDGTGNSYEPMTMTAIRVPPFPVTTAPPHGAEAVLTAAPMVITFSEAVVRNTLVYTVTPNPGGWAVMWSPDNKRVTLNHNNWSFSQTYTVTVSARDTDGRSLVPGPAPNPWSFTAQGPFPYITQANPRDGANAVLLTAPLVITFSEPVLTNSLLYTVSMDPGGWVATWDDNETTVTLDHNTWPCGQAPTVTVSVRDLENIPLVPGPVPNPFYFSLEACRLYLPVTTKGHVP